MNDIMMNEICAEDDKIDVAEEVIEDVVSILTNVVEEVDESELTDIQFSLEERNKNFGNNDERKEVHLEEINESTDDQNSLRLSTELSDDNNLEDLRINDKMAEHDSKLKDNFEEEDIDDSAQTAVDETLESEQIKDSSPTPGSIRDNEEVGSDSLAELTTDILSEAYIPPFPSTPSMSIMYADTTSDEDSDDEQEREIMPPVQRPEKPMQEDGVTMISVEENGKAEIITSMVKVTLDAGEMVTDDEFSEKLI
uniref:Acidic repeat-containing protein-like n=1 Tax=Heterorhabditis bacteriophora TaxID=37862 RepID=A0A1I7XBK9_HETBA